MAGGHKRRWDAAHASSETTARSVEGSIFDYYQVRKSYSRKRAKAKNASADPAHHRYAIAGNATYPGPFKRSVTIFVGPDRHLFVMDKEILCASSPFFKAALEGSFAEAQTGSVDLSEEDSDAMSAYCRLLNAEAKGRPASSAELGWTRDTYVFLDRPIRAYVLADMLGSLATRDRIFLLARDLLLLASTEAARYGVRDTVCSLRAVSYAWDRLPEGNAMRRLIVDFAQLGSWKEGALERIALGEYHRLSGFLNALFLATKLNLEQADSPHGCQDLDLVYALQKYSIENCEGRPMVNPSETRPILRVARENKDVKIWVKKNYDTEKYQDET